MESYKSHWFKKWAKKKGLTERQLVDAIDRSKSKLGIVDLGGNLYKIRIAKEGQGRSGGFRTILIFKESKRALFVYGFEKNDMDNIDNDQLEDYKSYAKYFLALDGKDVELLIENGTIYPLEDL